MFRNLFACFKKQNNTDLRESYQRRESSILQPSDCEDIYGRGSIILRESREMSNTSAENTSNEEIRIVAFGQIAEFFENNTLPSKLPNSSRKVARIGLGVNHAVFLFYGSEIAVVGKNDKGQIGFPIKEKDSENIYKDLQLTTFEQFISENKRVIDIAAGAHHTMLLVESISSDPEAEGEQREVYVMGDRNMLGKFETNDSHVPVLVTIPRLVENPSLRIQSIYSKNEK